MKIFFAVFVLLASSAMALDLNLTGKQALPKGGPMLPLRAGMGIVAKTDTVCPTMGSVYRLRLQNGQYVLFHGRLPRNSWKRVSAFQPVIGDAWSLLLGATFYAQAPMNSVPELTDVYWDGGMILVPGDVDSLYVKTAAEVQVLLAAKGRPVTLRVETEPRGAVVSLDGVPQGSTPMQLQWTRGNILRVRLDKLGYFSWEDVVEVDPDDPADLVVKLRERPVFQDGYPADTSGMDAHGSKDIHEVETMLSVLTSQPLTTGTSASAEVLYDYLDTLRQREYVEYIPPQNLSLAPWDSARGGIPVRVQYGANDFDFGFEGVLPCSFDESVALEILLKPTRKSATLKSSLRPRRSSWPSDHAQATLDGWLRLYYRNWLTDTRTNSREVRRYFFQDRLELVLPDRVVSIPGAFVPAAYIRNSADWQNLLQNDSAAVR